MPVKAFDEPDCIKNHVEALAALGSKAFLVTGRKSAHTCGALRDVEEALVTAGIPWVTFSEIEENPSTDTVMRAAELGQRAGVDFVIGIGGGSPMDAAKAISLMLCNPKKDKHFLYEKGNPADHLPIALIPTTCGTGSEVTGVAVLTNHETQTKGSIPYRIFATVAFLDGKYLAAAPHSVLANTGMDALSHLIESHVNTRADVYSRILAEAGLTLWAKSKDILLGQREATAADYANMLRASMLAGMAIAHTGTSLPHALSYPLTYHAGIAHGNACGYFLPGYLREADPDVASHLLQLAGFRSTDDLLEFYIRSCGTLSVSDALLSQALLVVLHNPDKLALAPYHTDETVLRRIVGLS